MALLPPSILVALILYQIWYSPGGVLCHKPVETKDSKKIWSPWWAINFCSLKSTSIHLSPVVAPNTWRSCTLKLWARPVKAGMGWLSQKATVSWGLMAPSVVKAWQPSEVWAWAMVLKLTDKIPKAKSVPNPNSRSAWCSRIALI